MESNSEVGDFLPEDSVAGEDKTWRERTSAAVGGCKRGCRQGSGMEGLYLRTSRPPTRGEFGCVFSLDCRSRTHDL